MGLGAGEDRGGEVEEAADRAQQAGGLGRGLEEGFHLFGFQEAFELAAEIGGVVAEGAEFAEEKSAAGGKWAGGAGARRPGAVALAPAGEAAGGDEGGEAGETLAGALEVEAEGEDDGLVAGAMEGPGDERDEAGDDGGEALREGGSDDAKVGLGGAGIHD